MYSGVADVVIHSDGCQEYYSWSMLEWEQGQMYSGVAVMLGAVPTADRRSGRCRAKRSGEVPIDS